MSDLATVVKENQELAERINRETLADPKSPYAGKYIGIANGKVAVIADSLTEVVERLEQIEPHRGRAMTLEASCDYNKVQYIGGF